MAKDKGTQQQEQNADRNTGISAGQTSGSTGVTGTNESQTDRERSIQRGREAQGAQTGIVGRTPITPMAYGPAVSPFSLMRSMVDDMDRLFANLGMGRTGFGLTTTPGSASGIDVFNDSLATPPGAWTPQVETFRRGDKLVVRADLPGLRKEDVNVEIDNDILTISGERRDEHEENRDGYYRSERTYGQFYRAVPLPEGISDQQCEASFQNGVLEVTLPAPAETEQRRKRIQIR